MIDAPWAGVIVTVAIALTGFIIALWKHNAAQNQMLHDRISRLAEKIETRFTDVDKAQRTERHALVAQFDRKDAEIVGEQRELRDRIIKLERNGGHGHG